MLSDNLIFYKDTMGLMSIMNDLMENIDNKEIGLDERHAKYYTLIGGLYSKASECGFEGNLWHCYLTEILVYSENPYSIACEKRGEVLGSLSEIILHDFRLFREMFSYDFKKLESVMGDLGINELISYQKSGKGALKYNKFIVASINELAVKLANSKDEKEFKMLMDEFYKRYGVGVFGLHKAFRVERIKEILHINPIYNIAVTSLDDIVGYDDAKKTLIDNTEAFINGKKANNCLIFGSAGTGKSSSIRAILNQYYDDGLRMIEVYKHQYQELNELIDRLKVRNYKFIIYMDDLSFEEFETDYKYLKAVIEGGLESKPDNVLIYATSNRRHLVKETFNDKDSDGGDIHKNETVQEKLSLFARFGVSIYFGAPSKKEFDNIVLTLAHKYEIPLSDTELIAKANMWELSHGGMSGRTARQFVNDLRGKF